MPYDNSRLKSCGNDVLISDQVIIKYPELVSIGDHVAIDGFVYISTALEIGSYVHIGPHVSIIGGRDGRLVMQDFSGMAAGCRIVCASDDWLGSGMTNPMIPEKYRGKVTIGTTVMGRHALLGTNCVVHPHVLVGEGAAVGSCSLVRNSLEPWAIYAGTPAVRIGPRPRRRILEYEQRLFTEENGRSTV